MKYKVLAVYKQRMVNIGDYIQALASKQFLPSKDGFVERDEIGSYRGEDCGVIMNGWFMHEPKLWPPSNKIRPLFVSMHINRQSESCIFEKDGIEYLKENEPIGCRDYYTVKSLQEKGIKAYFSGCMTLTLGEVYKYHGKRKGVYFVDPAYMWADVIMFPFLILKSILHVKSILMLYRKNRRYVTAVRHWCNMESFYSSYSKVFDREVLRSATYISHHSPFFKEHFQNNEKLMGCAETLVKKYAQAELVVTSRIHCALPCTGLDTPVIYVDNLDLNENERCRLDGLLQLLNIINLKKGKLSTKSLPIDQSEKISLTNLPPAKETWKSIAKELIERCETWVKSLD